MNEMIITLEKQERESKREEGGEKEEKLTNKDSQINGRGGKKQQTLTLTDHND